MARSPRDSLLAWRVKASYSLPESMPPRLASTTSKLVAPALLLSLLLAAWFFPSSGASGLALLALVAAGGAAIVYAGTRAPLEKLAGLPSWAIDVFLASLVALAGARVFGGVWDTSGHRIYDWGPHHANLAHLVEGLKQGRVPRWVQGVSTGDSPYELYPFLPYYLAARAAILFGIDDLSLVLVRSGISIHVLGAVGAALVTRRVVAWPWAALVGLASLYDVGSVWGGGADGLLFLGVTHSALANALWSFVLAAVLDALRRPRLYRTILIWVLVAFATACHPLGIISSLATSGALLLVAVLAQDVPPQRAFAALLHVVMGVLMVAWIWMPLNQRLLLYGVHFGLAGQLPWNAFEHLLRAPVPEASIAPLVYGGYLGLLVGIISRRAAPTLLAGFSAILMAGLFDQLYTLLDLAPSPELSRFQTTRLASSAKVGLYAMAMYLLAIALRAPWSRYSQRSRLVLGALLALGLAGAVRGAAPFFDRQSTQLRDMARREVPDPAGFRALIDWARERNAEMSPDRYARLLHEDERRFYSVYHVNAESGLPTLWVGPVSCLFLRERIENTSPESLRRFNVRWVVRRDQPPSLGDPATEERFGNYFVRELPAWDGAFARVERGNGSVAVTRLEDELVEVELSGSEPALVALGMGYYPRWQAVHEQRGALPVYGMPSISDGQLRVVSAWLPPGRTTFRPSGPLPSDADGRLLAGLVALLALAIVGVWSFPVARRAALLGFLRGKRAVSRHGRRLSLVAVGALGIGVWLGNLRSDRAPARALQLGNGLWSGASVEVRSESGEWRRCGYAPVYGAYRCAGPVLVQDSMADLLNDAPPSPPFSVPAIHVAASGKNIELRIRIEARLVGEYWAITRGGRVTLEVSDEPPITLSGRQSRHVYTTAEMPRDILLSATLGANESLRIAFVRRASLEPERPDVTPPEHWPLAAK